jgi:hypothetical protein
MQFLFCDCFHGKIGNGFNPVESSIQPGFQLIYFFAHNLIECLSADFNFCLAN